MSNYCILCGRSLIAIMGRDESNHPCAIGWKCDACGIQWPIADHKDSEDWAVRHIRILEHKIDDLTAIIEQLVGVAKHGPKRVE